MILPFRMCTFLGQLLTKPDKLMKSFPFTTTLLITLTIVSLSLYTSSYAQDASSKPLMGFSNDHAKAQRALESSFDTSLNPDTLKAWMKILTARPHHVGSQYDSINAEFIAAKYKSWGFDTKIEKFMVLFPTPKTRIMEMIEPEIFRATLEEPALKEDGTSNQTAEQLPIYNAYSIDGDVTGQLVFVNYGVPKDYEELEKNGIDVKGKIVIAKYGGAWRGIKPKVAAEHGAIGCLIYSDPKDDGYFQGDDYPTGAFRNSAGAQRGSVADMPLYSGDPSTPFVGATEDAKHVPTADIQTLTKIPVLPISYGDALPLLANLKGAVIPEDWRGALPLTYHFGPGPAKVHLKLEFNWDLTPIYDVIATIKGTDYPDEWIIRGNHHDAWVNGADDPISGQVATMAEGQAMGKLLKKGWKPKRTIVYCAWDGEEPGLLGSTEWVETHIDELQKKGVVYLNSDANGRGFVFMGGSHSLEKFVNQVIRDINDPERNITAFERAKELKIVNSSSDEQAQVSSRADLQLGALGSGSDFTPFLQHAGIASLNISYGGENDGGSYHSIYDSYDHYLRFGDPTFQYGVALSQTNGRVILRLANADLLPFEFSACSEAITKYQKEVIGLLDNLRKQTDADNDMIRQKYWENTSDPTQTFVVPKPKDVVPYLNFAPLQNATANLTRETATLQRLMSDSLDIKKLKPADVMYLDSSMRNMEHLLTSKDGLPGRPWYVHEVYAPGKYTGYGVKTLPSIREAIEQRNWKEAQEQITFVSGILDVYSSAIQRMAVYVKSTVTH